LLQKLLEPRYSLIEIYVILFHKGRCTGSLHPSAKDILPKIIEKVLGGRMINSAGQSEPNDQL